MTAGWRSGVAPNNFGYRFNHVAETFNARYPGNPSLFGQLWWQRILSRTLYMHLPLPKHCMFDSMNQSFLFSFEEASPFVQPHELYFFRVSYRLHLRNTYLVDLRSDLDVTFLSSLRSLQWETDELMTTRKHHARKVRRISYYLVDLDTWVGSGWIAIISIELLSFRHQTTESDWSMHETSQLLRIYWYISSTLAQRLLYIHAEHLIPVVPIFIWKGILADSHQCPVPSLIQIVSPIPP